MPRRRHPDRDVENALKYAEQHGWRIHVLSGHAHAWGRMYWPDECMRCGRPRHRMLSVASTLRNAPDHAADLRRSVRRCLSNREAARGGLG